MQPQEIPTFSEQTLLEHIRDFEHHPNDDVALCGLVHQAFWANSEGMTFALDEAHRKIKARFRVEGRDIVGALAFSKHPKAYDATTLYRRWVLRLENPIVGERLHFDGASWEPYFNPNVFVATFSNTGNLYISFNSGETILMAWVPHLQYRNTIGGFFRKVTEVDEYGYRVNIGTHSVGVNADRIEIKNISSIPFMCVDGLMPEEAEALKIMTPHGGFWGRFGVK